MEPLGKAVLGILTDQITSCIGPTLSCDPQYAHLPWRSTNDCLMAISQSQHCMQVTNLVAQYARPLHSHQCNTDIPSIYGGLMLVLDISKAFDSVNRTKLLEHVATLGLPHGLVMLIRAWHHDTNYHLIHHGQTYTIKVTSGIRQGCRLAPILWACYVHCFFVEAAHEIPRSWLEIHINVFADDFHFSCLVTTWTDMKF